MTDAKSKPASSCHVLDPNCVYEQSGLNACHWSIKPWTASACVAPYPESWIALVPEYPMVDSAGRGSVKGTAALRCAM
jgi:hypothetical protein